MVSAELLSDASLEQVAPGSVAVCGADITTRLSKPRPDELKQTVHLSSNDTDHICVRIRKSTQLQLRTLFQSFKRESAAAAVSSSSGPSAAPATPPAVPVLAVTIRVTRGSLKCAYMAINRPFPSRTRHQWIWTPGITKKKREVSTHVRTMGHQMDEDNAVDASLGPSGCVFDMHAAATNFFATSQFFLSVTGMENKLITGPGVPLGTHKGGTEVVVSAKVVMRAPVDPTKPVLKEAGFRTAAQKKSDQEKAAAVAAKLLGGVNGGANSGASGGGVAQSAMQKLLLKKKKKDEDASQVANDDDAGALSDRRSVVAAAPPSDESDPFAETPRVTDQEQERKYDDPFAESVPNSARPTTAIAADDPFADMTDTPPKRNVAATAADDPFASMPPTPLQSDRPAGDEPEDDNESLASDRTDVLAGVSSPAISPLSPDLLGELESARPTPQQALSDRASLSLATTPLVRPVPKDERVLDALPDTPLARPAPPPTAPLITADELSVPLESLPTKDTRAPRVDVLASVPTPQVTPRPLPDGTLSQLPTPALKPVPANPAALDKVALDPAVRPPPRADTRVLDSLPTPKVRPSASSESIDSMPAEALPPSHALPVVFTAPPVSSAEVDALLAKSPPKPKKTKQKSTTRPVAPLPPRPSLTRPVSIQPASSSSPSPFVRPVVAQPLSFDLSPDVTPRGPAAVAAAASNPLDELPSPAVVATRAPLNDALFESPLPPPVAAAPVSFPPSPELALPPAAAQPARPAAADLDDLLGDEPDPPAAPAADLNVLDDL